MLPRLIITGLVALPIAIAPIARQTSGREAVSEGSGVLPKHPDSQVVEAGMARDHGVPPQPWADDDPADSLYRAGREAINRGDFRRAASIFADIPVKYPKSEYAPDALYWRAFALYKVGRDDDLREALKALESQKSKYPKAPTVKDGEELAVRIRGVLAQQGDADAAADVSRRARQDVPCRRDDNDSDVRAAAMNALLQMDAENALPIIKQVLQKRDACSIALREKAVFLLSQKQTSETEDMLVDVVKSDPAESVKEQAVFWMGQVNTDKAAAALEQIATASPNMELRKKAVFALSQLPKDEGVPLLIQVAKTNKNPAVRKQAMFWLGQSHDPRAVEFFAQVLTK